MSSDHPDLLRVETATIRALRPWAAWPGIVVRDGDVAAIECPVPSILFNGVLRAVLDDPATVEDRIDATLEGYRALGVPMAWWVGPSSRPRDLPDRLASRGLMRGEPSEAMTLDLESADLPAPPGSPGPGRDDIRPVAGGDDLAAWSVAVNDAFGTSDEATAAWLDLHRALARDDRGAGWHHWIARRDGRTAGAASLFLDPDDAPAVVANVAVRHRFRREGLGTALTLAMLRAARRAGRREAVLNASGPAIRLYERVGFRPCGSVPILRTPRDPV